MIRVDDGGLAVDVEVTDRSVTHAARLDGLHLPMLGHHNALNAIAAIAVAREMGLEEAGIRKALDNFGGVKRRFNRPAEAGSIADITDYGHPPVEIAAVLATARPARRGRGIAVVPPPPYLLLPT